MTAPKLTKAQRLMLYDAVRLGRVKSGGIHPFRHATAEALERLGLIRKLKGSFSLHRENTVYWQGWEITDAGRAALKDGSK